MTRESAELTSDDLQKVEGWFRSKGIVLTCPICKSSNWGSFGHIVAPMTYSPGAFQIGGTSYPTVNLVCTNCGSIQAFSAVLLGLT